MNNNYFIKFSRKNGFGLAELLVYLFISSILLIVINKIFLDIIYFRKKFIDFSHFQTKTRIILSMLLNEARMSGYLGCSRLSANKYHCKTAYCYTDSINVIDSELINITNIKKNSKALIINEADFFSTKILNVNNDLNKITIDGNIKFSVGNYIVIYNCLHADILKIKDIEYNQKRQIISLDNKIDIDDLHDLYINKFHNYIYYTCCDASKNYKAYSAKKYNFCKIDLSDSINKQTAIINDYDNIEYELLDINLKKINNIRDAKFLKIIIKQNIEFPYIKKLNDKYYVISLT